HIFKPEISPELLFSSKSAPIEPWHFSGANNKSLALLFSGFLEYYAYFEWTQNVPSIRSNSLLRRSKKNPQSPCCAEKAIILIEDPISRKNAARFCTNQTAFVQVMKVFQYSVDWLKVSNGKLDGFLLDLISEE
ncbi:MAG: hypothetical protein MHPSP_002475, partial [Paramarteilia canceri]